MSPSNAQTSEHNACVDSEVSAPIMECDICESLQYPDFQHNMIQLHTLEEAVRRGCQFCRVILTGVNFFQNVSDQADGRRPGLILDAVCTVPQRYYSGFVLRAVSLSHCPDSFIDLEFHMDEEITSPWPVFKSSRSVSSRLDIDSTVKYINAKMRECENDHFYCSDFAGSASIMPSRVLDVRRGQEDEGISLVETNRQLGKYITLSHCWGQVEFIQTTTATLEERKKIIPLAQLPQTFKDAVAISRGVGAQYLWIDSLCIIQDDLPDWEVESSRMADVFSGSWLNIAITHAANSGTGCFVDRTCRQFNGVWNPTTYRVPATQSLHPPILVRPDLGLVHLHMRSPEKSWFYKLKLPPLFTRGWIYQERMLSPRTVYFDSSEMIWDCISGHSCECGKLNYETRTLTMDVRDALYRRQPAKNERYWATIVYVYSGLDITKPEDRLPALSGVASLVGEQLCSDYLAGLWRRFLPQELLWTAHISRLPEHRYVRSRPYRAPTWSWASLDIVRNSDQRVELGGGAIVFQSILLPGRRYKYLEEDSPEYILDSRFHIDSAWCEVLGKNPYGRVSAGELTFRAAYVVPNRVQFCPGLLECNYHLSFDSCLDTEFEESKGMLRSDLETAADYPDAKNIVCILMYQTKHRHEFGDMCFVIKPSRETPGKYERMGVMDCPKDVYFFVDAKEGTFHII